jgi:hypothetical protein
VGPTRVEVRALGAPVAIATTSEGGARRTVPEHAALRDGERRTPIEVGPGVHTVTVRLDTGTAEAQLVATTPDESVPFARSPRHPVEGGERWLEPDRRRIRTYHTDLAAGLGEVCWRTDGEGDDLSRTTRLDVRLLGDAATSAEAVEVRYRFLDAEGRAIAEGAARVASTWSDFEFVEVRPETSASTTEPVPLYLVAPPRAVSLCAATTTGAVLRALTPTPDEDALDPVYAEHVSEEVRWRYAPMRWRPWLPLRALAHAELESASRATLLIAQSRLELPARADGSSAAERHYTELQPFGRPPRERILEQVEDTARGPSELFVETPRAPIDVVGGGDASAARAVYWLEEGAEIGGELTIVSGAETLLRTVLRARSGALSFGPLGPAPQPLRALGPSSARVFVAASPVRAGLPRFALRTAFALLPAAPLRVSTPARSRSLWVVVYARGTAPLGDLVLRARVDGGSPERRVGVPLTSVGRAERAWTVPGSTEPPALFLDRRDLGGLRPRIVRIPLGADLAETRHLVDVWLEVGAAGSVFARLLVETAGVEAGEPAVPLFRRSVVPIEDGDD